MLASELSRAIATLTATHGDCPVFHEERGRTGRRCTRALGLMGIALSSTRNRGSYDTSPVQSVQSVEAITQKPLPPGSHPAFQTLVPAGTTYFLIR
jgi:hypothetical protein